MAVAIAAAAVGPLVPYKLVYGRGSGTGAITAQLPFVPDFCVATTSGPNGVTAWTASSTTAGLLKITGLSTTTSGVVSFIAGKLA